MHSRLMMGLMLCCMSITVTAESHQYIHDQSFPAESKAHNMQEGMSAETTMDMAGMYGGYPMTREPFQGPVVAVLLSLSTVEPSSPLKIGQSGRWSP